MRSSRLIFPVPFSRALTAFSLVKQKLNLGWTYKLLIPSWLTLSATEGKSILGAM